MFIIGSKGAGSICNDMRQITPKRLWKNIELCVYHSIHKLNTTLSVQSPVVVNLISTIVDEIGMEKTVQCRTTENTVPSDNTILQQLRFSLSIHVNVVRLVSLQYGPFLQHNDILGLTPLENMHLIELHKRLHFPPLNCIQQLVLVIG